MKGLGAKNFYALWSMPSAEPLLSSDPETFTAADYRLPRSIVPRRYDLTLSPDLGQKDFVGSVAITLAVGEDTAAITLNCKDLVLGKAWLIGDDGTRNEATAIELDDLRERATLSFERTVPTGDAVLQIQFTGILNDKLRGFYASTYVAENGSTKTIATTQMQSTDARTAFPCWDEPDRKAVFAVTLIVNDGLLAVSNMHELSRTTMASGKQAVRFADTPLMSTYLVAFVVGELEATAPIDVDGIAVRVIARPGTLHLAAFGLESAAFALRYFQDWYGIAYPGSKLDLIATPDFAFGAMENLGAVTFRETLLLADPAKATRMDLENIAAVVAHEIAHMWFGDLVTMRWWNGIWLNEAFATFAEISCTATFKPEWDKWTTFAVMRAAAAAVDGLHNTRPIEYEVVAPGDVEGMFDLLTYEKGASVLRQLEQFLGEKPFRDGVRHYLQTHLYGNTETTDLFDAIEHVTKVPVRALMDSWIFQGGYPIVSVSHDPVASTVTFSQRPFTYLPKPGDDRSWSIPILFATTPTATTPAATPNGEPGPATEHRLLLDVASATVAVPPGTALVVANAGGHGFYRVAYDAGLQQAIRSSFASLAPVERFHVVSDLWASVQSGSASAEEFLDLTDTLASERHVSVWRAAIGGWGSLDLVFNEGRRNDLAVRAQRVLAPLLNELTWDATEGESPLIGQLRGLVISTLGTLAADLDVAAKAASAVSDVLADRSALPGDVGAAVLTVAAAHGDASLWAAFDAARSSAASPQAAVRLLRALGTFPGAAEVQASLALLLAGTVRSQDAPYAINMWLTSRTAGPMTWAFVRDNWDPIVAAFPDNGIPRMIETLGSLSTPESAAEITAFFGLGGRDIPQGRKQLAQMLERLSMNVGLRSREHTLPAC